MKKMLQTQKGTAQDHQSAMKPIEHTFNGSHSFTCTHLLNTSYSREIYSNVREGVMISSCTDSVRVEGKNEKISHALLL